MSVFKYHKPGIGNASSYIVSGVPWYTSSLAPALSTTSKVVNFPRVTNYVVVKNNSTTDDILRFTFNNDNIVDNTNYITLEGGESFSGELRTTDVHFISDTETPVPFTVVAGLTNIERQEMTQTTPTAPNLLAWVQKQKLIANDPDGSPEGDYFGALARSTISQNEKRIFIGAFGDEGPSGELFAGSIYLFEEIDGQFEQIEKLAFPDSISNPTFAVLTPRTTNEDGSKLFVSGPGGNGGKIFIYESGSSGFSVVQEITSDSPSTTTGFASGQCFSIGDFLFVGSNADDRTATNAGSVTIFQSSSLGYQQIQRITSIFDTNGTPDTLSANDNFGQFISATSDLQKLFISSPGDDEAASNAGAVYIFQSSSLGYQQVQKLTASFDFDGSPETVRTSNNFGQAHASVPSGDILAIGAAFDEENGVDSGAVYIFKSGSIGYQQVQKFSASFNSDGTPETSPEKDQFGGTYIGGIRISEDGSVIAISAINDEEDGGSGDYLTGGGAVYVYVSSSAGYVQQAKLLSLYNTDGTLETPVERQFFGNNSLLSRDGKTLIVDGNDPENGVDSGAVYIFKYTRDY
jgi:hypothetical protein